MLFRSACRKIAGSMPFWQTPILALHRTLRYLHQSPPPESTRYLRVLSWTFKWVFIDESTEVVKTAGNPHLTRGAKGRSNE